MLTVLNPLILRGPQAWVKQQPDTLRVSNLEDPGPGNEQCIGTMEGLIVSAGVGQLLLALASLAIVKVLRWRRETAKLEPLTRQVFWTYAGYIWGTNVCFGLLSSLAPELLLYGLPLARTLCAFIALYWDARFFVQLGFFRKHTPAGLLPRLAEGC